MPEFAPVLNVSSLNGASGFRLDGEAASDKTGFVVAGAGDVNGDGFADLLTAAPYSTTGGLFRGLTYVVFGSAVAPAAQGLAARLAAGTAFRFQGEALDDRSGFSVNSAGDVNGDGFDDIFIGAPLADPDGLGSEGASYLVLGGVAKLNALDLADGSDDGAVSLSNVNGVQGFRFDGVASSDGGRLSVSGAGDVNGDGFADLIIGNKYADVNGGSGNGASYLVLGGLDNLSDLDDDDGTADGHIDLAQISAGKGMRIDGAKTNIVDASGTSVAAAGDVNGDGFDDLIIGAIGADPDSGAGNDNEGAAYIVFGRPDDIGFPATLNLAAPNGVQATRLDGAQAQSLTGTAVNGAGDINGDGLDDVVIGAYRAEPPGLPSNTDSGSAYVVFGKSAWGSSFDLSALDGSNGFRVDGLVRGLGGFAGLSVSAAGDVNGDGFGDVLISSEFSRLGAYGVGAAFVVFGSAGGFAPVIDLGSLDGNDGFRIEGAAAGDNLANRVAGPAGDVNGDGFDDIVLGATNADNGGSTTGSTYVVFGHRALTDVNRVGTDLDNRINGGVGDDVIKGLSGNDTLIGWEGTDTIWGGDGNDTVVAGEGEDEIFGGSGRDTFDLVAFGNIGVTLNLASGTFSHPNGEDIQTLVSIENVFGANGNDVLTGNFKKNTLAGRNGDDVLNGAANNDFLIGRNGNDTINGGADNDALLGGLGVDSLTGGTGADRFDFNLITESGLSAAARDTISGFEQGLDLIDLATIDANTAVGGDQAFTFIGTAAFFAPGQVRAVNFSGDTIVQASNDADTSPEMAFTISGLFTLADTDFGL